MACSRFLAGSTRTRTWCTRGLPNGSGSRSGWMTSGPAQSGHRGRHHDDRQHDVPDAGRRRHGGDAGRRDHPGDGGRRRGGRSRLVLAPDQPAPTKVPGPELAADVAPVQNVAQDPVHVPWLPPWLQASAIAMTATVVTSHNSSTACCKPRRWYARRVCRGSGRERRTARREPTWIFSRAGISSPDASRVNMVSRATSAGSQLARSSLIEFRACCSHVLMLITGPPIASPRPPRSRRLGEHRDEPAGGAGRAGRAGTGLPGWPRPRRRRRRRGS